MTLLETLIVELALLKGNDVEDNDDDRDDDGASTEETRPFCEKEDVHEGGKAFF